MLVRDLIANHAHTIGHRRLVQGEVWCRMQFRDDEDFNAFAKTLRWSAFRFEQPKAETKPETKPEPEQPPKSSRR